MTGHGGNLVRALVTFALLLTSFWLCALRPAAAQGRGNGGGNGGGGGDTGGGQTGWIERFDSILGMLANGWGIEQTGSPDSLFGVPGAGLASKSFDATNVTIPDGILRLRLSISETSPNSFTSSGALVYTKQTYGYGTYEWCARMSSTASSPTTSGEVASGGVSAGFVYVNNSQTEIDFELARFGSLDWRLYMANWAGLRRHTYDTVKDEDSLPNDFHASFKVYKFVWTKDYIEFLVDGRSLAFHTTNIPRAAAHVMANHWGTNNPTGFGGEADTTTTKRERYFYVDWVRYTPPFGLPVGGTVACGPGSASP